MPSAPDAAPPAPDHRIRLRGPWAWRPENGDTLTVSLPHAAATAGTLTRRFNTPTGLDDGTRVRLRIDADGAAEVTLNGAVAEPGADVTARLGGAGSRCKLAVTLPAGAALLAAALELFEPRYDY